MSDEVLNFDLTPVEVPVVVGGVNYKLREATGDAACKYQNARLSCTRIGTDGKPTTIIGAADVEPLLVSLCLFQENGAAVPLATIKKWPHKVQRALFKKAEEISELGADDLETLEKQLEVIQKRIAALKKDDGPLPNELDSTASGSA